MKGARGDLGSGGLSLVGAAEGNDTAVAAPSGQAYDAPATPLDRLLRDSTNPSPCLAELIAPRNQINPFDLSNRIQAKIDQVHRLARRHEPTHTSSDPTPLTEGSHPLLDPPPRGGGRPRPEAHHAKP